jgi:hypothetical protein
MKFEGQTQRRKVFHEQSSISDPPQTASDEPRR